MSDDSGKLDILNGHHRRMMYLALRQFLEPFGSHTFIIVGLSDTEGNKPVVFPMSDGEDAPSGDEITAIFKALIEMGCDSTMELS